VTAVVRYVETFFRHRRLFVAPVLVAFVAGIVLAFLQPSNTTALARIWYDLTPPLALSTALNSGGQGTPADLQAQVLTELVNTRSFAAKVVALGPLGDYIRTPTGYLEAVDTIQAAKTRLAMAIGRPLPSISKEQEIDLASMLLSKNTTVAAVGPQIVVVTLHLQSQDAATATLKNVVDQYTDVVLNDRRTQAQAAVDFWQTQVDLQRIQVDAGDAAVVKYLDDHPELAGLSARPDVVLTGLRTTQDLQRQRYETLVQNRDQAQLALSASTTPSASGFSVIDEPRAVGGVSGLRKELLVVLGGLVAGILLSLAGVVALTLVDPTLRREEDVTQATGLRVVGTLPDIADSATPWP
jgi:uncharacterized protein involved in exopolysaccharide biosynthesis